MQAVAPRIAKSVGGRPLCNTGRLFLIALDLDAQIDDRDNQSSELDKPRKNNHVRHPL